MRARARERLLSRSHPKAANTDLVGIEEPFRAARVARGAPSRPRLAARRPRRTSGRESAGEARARRAYCAQLNSDCESSSVRRPRPDAPLALPPPDFCGDGTGQVSLPSGEACTLRQRHSGCRRHSGRRTPRLSRPIDAPRTRTLSCARHNRSASAIRRDALEMGVCTTGIPAG